MMTVMLVMMNEINFIFVAVIKPIFLFTPKIFGIGKITNPIDLCPGGGRASKPSLSAPL